MATSLMNDKEYCYRICRNLLKACRSLSGLSVIDTALPLEDKELSDINRQLQPSQNIDSRADDEGASL